MTVSYAILGQLSIKTSSFSLLCYIKCYVLMYLWGFKSDDIEGYAGRLKTRGLQLTQHRVSRSRGVANGGAAGARGPRGP